MSHHQHSSRRRLATGLAAFLAATSSTAAVGTAAAAPGAAAAGTKAGGECRVLRLAQAKGVGDGSVMDIERVGEKVVYYGNGYRFDRHGEEHQRAFIWSGRKAQPVRVGPRGFDHDIALELTASGLVNGYSENLDGSSAPWVQDLATGEITYFDEDSGPRGAEHGFTLVRRVNDSGQAVGLQVRSSDPDGWQTDAIAYDSPTGDLRVLPDSASSFDAVAFGINNDGDRVGYVADGTTHPDDENFFLIRPRVWRADGTVDELVHPNAMDAFVRAIKDDGSASGEMSWGDHPSTAHVEASYWPTPEENIGLGVLPGGGWSAPFGMDEGGYLVGVMDRGVRDGNRFGPGGWVDHAFHWTPALGEGVVRILPSYFGARHGTGWRTWATGHAAHAVNSELDQAGTATHWKFRGKRLVFGPTVWLNASRCGVERPTTHDPFGLEERIAAPRSPREVRMDVRAWKRALATQ